MKIRFIINPCSGRNSRRPWLADYIEAFVARHHLNASISLTAYPGHATELAREGIVTGCDRIVAVGGDGTMNEVAQALVHSPAALGLVPCGSGNGLARHLGVPAALDAALNLAVSRSSRTVTIDTGSANGKPFFNAMGCGFDAEISRRFNRLKRRGLPAYARTGLAAFMRRTSEQVVVRTRARTITFDALLISVANSEQYGNGAIIAPGASVHDGELDLVAIRPVSALAALPLLARLFLRRLHQSGDVIHLRGDRFTIQRSTSGIIHTDGETHETGALIEIEVRARSLKLIVPGACMARIPAAENLLSPVPLQSP